MPQRAKKKSRTHLEDERRELKTSNHSVTVDVRHILVGKNDVVLGGTVIGLKRRQRLV